MKPLRHRHRQKYLRGHLSLTTRRPGFVAQRGRTSVRSVHCTAGRRVADGGDPGGVGDLLTQGHLHPASSPGVNLTPARPLVDRPGHLSFWPACPGLNLQKEEEAKSAGSRRGPRGRRRPWIRAQHPLFLLRVFVLPSAPALARCLGRPAHLSLGTRRTKGGDFRTPLLTLHCRRQPRFPRTASARRRRRPPWVTTLSPAII